MSFSGVAWEAEECSPVFELIAAADRQRDHRELS